MIKGKYTLIENQTNIFEIYENQTNQSGQHQSTVMTDHNFSKKQSICIGSLAQQNNKSCCSLHSHHVIENLQLKMYDQTLSYAYSNIKDKYCWRCEHQLRVVTPKRIVIGSIVKKNVCSLSCGRQVNIEIRDSSDAILFLIFSQCCQLANFIPDCCGFLRCNSSILYQIQDNSGNKIGMIENKTNSKCGISRKFELDIPTDKYEIKKRLLLINAILLLL